MTEKNQLEIDQSEFEFWQKSLITQELFKVLEADKKILEQWILGLDPLNDDKVEKRLAYLRGKIDVYDSMLNITFDELFTIEEERENEET